MLGEQLLTHSDPSKPTGTLRPTEEVLANKKFLLLYFSASWCGPCKKFTPFFSVVYEDLKASAERDEVEVRSTPKAPDKRNKSPSRLLTAIPSSHPPTPLQVVLVSHDNTASEFNEYYAEMLWPAIPFASDKRDAVSEQHGVEGIPEVICIRVADGTVVKKGCRELINAKKTLAGIF